MNKRIITLILAGTALLCASCTDQQIEASLPFIGEGISLGVTATLAIVKVPAPLLAEVQGYAAAVYSCTGGNAVPAVADLQEALKNRVSSAQGQVIANLIINTYAKWFPKILTANNKVKVANDILATIAENLLIGSGAVVPTTTTTTASRHKAGKLYHTEMLAFLRQNHIEVR
jgi:hypothetical protein